jgi:hypothetical protein
MPPRSVNEAAPSIDLPYREPFVPMTYPVVVGPVVTVATGEDG